jgi:hypothetical protein
VLQVGSAAGIFLFVLWPAGFSYQFSVLPTESAGRIFFPLLLLLISLLASVPQFLGLLCQLTLGCIVKRCWDHVRLLYDLPNSTSLAKKIVTSSVLSITKILIIEDHKFDITFLHVVFRSQSLLKLTSDQTGSDTN